MNECINGRPPIMRSASKTSKVHFSKTIRVYVINVIQADDEVPAVWTSPKENAETKRKFARTVRKTWEILNDTEIHPDDKEVLLYNCMGLEHHLCPEVIRGRRARHLNAVLEIQALQRNLKYCKNDIEMVRCVSSESSKQSRKRAHQIALLYHQFLTSKGK